MKAGKQPKATAPKMVKMRDGGTVKASGTKQRGSGAAKKGFMSRGPMA